jgi:hypothetical protein
MKLFKRVLAMLGPAVIAGCAATSSVSPGAMGPQGSCAPGTGTGACCLVICCGDQCAKDCGVCCPDGFCEACGELCAECCPDLCAACCGDAKSS